jgi:hypothetical protein
MPAGDTAGVQTDDLERLAQATEHIPDRQDLPL